MQPNTTTYIVAYATLMVPTYILPYVGSNSSIINAVSAVAGFGMTPQWWAHAWSLTMLCLLAWTRGGVIDRTWLPILPTLASVFDLTPVLSSLPLAPTLLHIGGILSGVISVTVHQRDAAANQQRALNRTATQSAVVATLCAVSGSVLFMLTIKSTEKNPAAPATANSTASPSPTLIIPPLASLAPPPTAIPTPPETSSTTGKQASTPHPSAPRISSPVAKATPSSTGTTSRYINLND